MAMTDSISPSAPAPMHQDVRTISLIGLAHGTSHFFHMLLPPLFPAFIAEFGLSYSQLGLLVSVFFVVSGVGQALAGFVVDRIGARPVLYASLLCFVLAALAAATAHGYAGLVLAAGLAGVGNSPFHPVDFTILNKRVSQRRLGHAFSAHGISGNLGWAVAPVFLLGVNQATGSWRMAAAAAGAVALAVLALMLMHRDALDDRPGQAADSSTTGSGAGTAGEHPLAFLQLPAVWLSFSFFFWVTVTLSAMQSFAAPALRQMYGLPASTTAFVVTAYMLCGAAGMMLGGFLVAGAARLERVIALAMGGAALLMGLTASGWLPGPWAAVTAALAGFGGGLAGPSRDMLVKRAAPPGATGRVYGTVYSGLDIGFALSAPVFGWLMDHQLGAAVFQGAALALLLGIVSAALVGARVARTHAGQPPDAPGSGASRLMRVAPVRAGETDR
jgi:FSR family fosmidomycin resistance protein-like MFS transporter